jgi:hypothetical protein
MEAIATTWWSLCDVDRLEFRAVCNQVAPASRQPVSRRIIRNISASSDAHGLFQNCWFEAMRLGTPIERHFYDALLESASWKTLVLEAIAGERGAPDSSGGQSWIDRLWSWYEKLNGKETAGTLLKIVTATAGAAIVVQYSLPKAIEEVNIPLAAHLQNGALSVPISLTPSQNLVLPISVALSDDQAPLPVKLKVDAGDPVDVQKLLGPDLSSTNKSIKAATAELHKIANALSMEDRGNLPTLFDGVGREIHGLTSEISKGVELEGTLSAGYLDAMRNNVRSFEQNTVALHLQDTVVRPHSTKSVVAPWLDAASDRTSLSTITLCTREISAKTRSRYVEIFMMEDSSSQSCDSPLVQYQRYWEGVQMRPSKNWNLVVTSIDKRWPGGLSARIALSPVPMPGTVSVAQQKNSD